MIRKCRGRGHNDGNDNEEEEEEEEGAYLQAGVDGEGAGSRVHAGHVLRLVNLLEGKLDTVVPVLVVNVLAHEGVWLYREILVHLPSQSHSNQCSSSLNTLQQ